MKRSCNDDDDDDYYFNNDQEGEMAFEDDAHRYYENVRDRSVFTIPSHLMRFFIRELSDIVLREEQRVIKKLQSVHKALESKRVASLTPSSSSKNNEVTTCHEIAKEVGDLFGLPSPMAMNKQLAIEESIYNQLSIANIVQQRLQFRHNHQYYLASLWNKRHIFYCMEDIFNYMIIKATRKSCAMLRLTCTVMFNNNLLIQQSDPCTHKSLRDESV